MIKLIKNDNKLSECLKEDRVAKSKRIRESLNNKKLKEHTSLETSFEVDEIGDRPIHKSINFSSIPSSRQIREIIDSYDLDELEDSNDDVIDDTVNEIILDCIDEVKNKPEPFTQAWDDLYEKLETIVYRIVKHQYGFIKSLDEGKQVKTKSKRQNSRVEKIDKLIDDIYDERKSSISKDGEYGVGNQTFKEFRNRGYLDKLKKLKQKELNKELSLEELATKETCK